ncbi:hypothetical protein BK026_09345 [Alteromonas sp. V450]|nr:TnsD family Tn7-like transposition protein [Alteromonas sp. V450]OJF68982.1 hypothetical protein BK026_09345 [Alteromonas sp. V450]
MLVLLPDETIYSYLIRCCLMDGYPTLACALKYKIGSSSKQWSASFPSFISQVSLFSGIPFQQLLYKHTVYPLYRTFLSQAVSTKVEQLLLAGGTLNLESKMSLVANRSKMTGELKYCPLCTKQDIEKYAWCYWHLQHQLPGALACAIHDCKLEGIKVNRKRLILPPTEKASLSTVNEKAVKLAMLSQNIFKLGGYGLNSEIINRVYRHRLVELGLATCNQSIRIKVSQWRKHLRLYWESICDEPQISQILSKSKSWQYPANLLYGKSKTFHPLKHLLVIGHMFNTFDEFMSIYRLFEKGQEPCVDSKVEVNGDNLARSMPDKKILSFLENGYSLRQTSSLCGVSIGYTKKIAQISGIAIHRRSQFIDERKRREIWRKLLVGLSTQNIAASVETSVGAVEQILSCHPELVQLRKKIRFHNLLKKHRGQLISAVQSSTSRQEVKKAVSSSYTWLFKHDKDWLYSQLPAEIPRSQRYKRGG